MTPAELAIRAAMEAVERTGADVRLTDAVVLLSDAREKVADYVDCKPETYWFVEYRSSGNFGGWWASPGKGSCGRLTTDPLLAKRYTQAEARAVATALSEAAAPFERSEWIATEHEFVFLD